MMPSFQTMFRRLRSPEDQSRTAKTVEIFGWILLLESVLIFLAPRLVASLLHLPLLERAAANSVALVAFPTLGLFRSDNLWVEVLYWPLILGILLVITLVESLTASGSGGFRLLTRSR